MSSYTLVGLPFSVLVLLAVVTLTVITVAAVVVRDLGYRALHYWYVRPVTARAPRRVSEEQPRGRKITL